MDVQSEKFARALGEALQKFLDEREITATDAADRMGFKRKTLSTYWNDNRDGKRNKPRAELLFQACVELGFVFEYEGRQVGAVPSRNGNGGGADKSVQLSLPFMQTFEFTNDQGSVSVSVKRPAGRVEFSVSLKAVS